MASILKVDKKRQNLFEIVRICSKIAFCWRKLFWVNLKLQSQTNNTPGIEQINQNTLVIDRYKYLDLYPATPAELKSMGYIEAGGGNAKKYLPVSNPYAPSPQPQAASVLVSATSSSISNLSALL